MALVAERNTAVQLAFADGVLTLDAGSGDEAQASESIEAEVDGDPYEVSDADTMLAYLKSSKK